MATTSRHAMNVIDEALDMATKWPIEQLRAVVGMGKARLSFGVDPDISKYTAEALSRLERILSEREKLEG